VHGGRQGARLAAATIAAVAAAGVATGGLAGCSGGTAPAQQAAPPAKMLQIGRGPVPSVVLTPTGERRIGLQTAPVTAMKGGVILVPYEALLYEPDGSTAVYVNTGPLTYTRYLVSVQSIAGASVYVSKGLTPGMKVVTAGAEELLGVQNGVGVET